MSLEEMGFGSSAVCEPLRVKHMCDEKCNEMASGAVILQLQIDRTRRDESEQRSLERDHNTKDLAKQVVGPRSGQMDSFKKCGSDSPSRRGRPGSYGKRQQQRCLPETDSSPYKEELVLLRMGNDLRLEGSSMRQAREAGEAGDRAEFLEIADSAHGQA